jgi:hypothetical protein
MYLYICMCMYIYNLIYIHYVPTHCMYTTHIHIYMHICIFGYTSFPSSWLHGLAHTALVICTTTDFFCFPGNLLDTFLHLWPPNILPVLRKGINKAISKESERAMHLDTRKLYNKSSLYKFPSL